MSDVCERSAVNDCRYAFQSLNQIRFQSILQKSCHSAFCMQIACRYRFLLGSFASCVTNDNSCQSLLQVKDIACQTQNCHNLGCNGDVIAVFSRHTVGLSAKAIHYITKLTVIHIHASSPGDLSGVDVQIVALENMVVNHSCQKIVCCADCVEVTGKVKVDVLHGNNLCIAAACCSALYTEHGSKGWLTKRNHDLLAELLHTVCQTYGRGSLALSCGSRVDRGNEDQLAVGSI